MPIGSKFDDFLKAEGIYEGTTANLTDPSFCHEFLIKTDPFTVHDDRGTSVEAA